MVCNPGDQIAFFYQNVPLRLFSISGAYDLCKNGWVQTWNSNLQEFSLCLKSQNNLSYKTGDKAESVTYKWGKVFKNGASKIYGRQPLKICGRQPLKILLGPFWNTLSQMFILRRVNMSLILKALVLSHLKNQKTNLTK